MIICTSEDLHNPKPDLNRGSGHESSQPLSPATCSDLLRESTACSDILRESTSCGVTSDEYEEDDELIRIELETILGKDILYLYLIAQRCFN